MICRRCLLRLARPPHIHRPFSSIPRRASAEPFTVPATMSPSTRGAPEAELGQKKASSILKSSVSAGTPLKGLNFYKDKEPPLAMEDSEYPEWLWTVLSEVKGAKTAGAGGVVTKKQAKQLKKQAKRAARSNATPDLDAEQSAIPINEQTIDLPVGDGTQEGVAEVLRTARDLTKSLRAERRAAIKESNFLKTM